MDIEATIAALAGGDRPAARQVARALDAAHASRDKAGLAEILDPLARSASTSPAALTTLLDAIRRLRLAEAAVRAVLIDPADVDDATQTTLLAVARSVGTYRGGARFTTWLHQVARNEALMFLRAKGRRPEPADPGEVSEPNGWRVSSLIADAASVRALVDQLPPAQREVLELREVHDLDYDEIARRLGVPVGTVRSRLARARAALDELVAREFVAAAAER